MEEMKLTHSTPQCYWEGISIGRFWQLHILLFLKFRCDSFKLTLRWWYSSSGPGPDEHIIIFLDEMRTLNAVYWLTYCSCLVEWRKTDLFICLISVSDRGQGEGRPWYSCWYPQRQGRLEGEFISVTLLFNVYTSACRQIARQNISTNWERFFQLESRLRRRKTARPSKARKMQKGERWDWIFVFNFSQKLIFFRFGFVKWSPQCLQASSGKSCRFLVWVKLYYY